VERRIIITSASTTTITTVRRTRTMVYGCRGKGAD
jgi:hypothetical protein